MALLSHRVVSPEVQQNKSTDIVKWSSLRLSLSVGGMSLTKAWAVPEILESNSALSPGADFTRGLQLSPFIG